MGAAAHAAIPARVHAAVDAVEPAWVRVLGTVKATVKMVVVGAADVAEHRESWTAFNLLEQT
jgi:hypothetical protein